MKSIYSSTYLPFETIYIGWSYTAPSIAIQDYPCIGHVAKGSMGPEAPEI